VTVFIAVLVPHVLLALAGRRDVVPPAFLGAVAWIAGLRVRTAGKPVAARRRLFLANHLSWLDIPALAGTTGAAFVAHAGLAGHPVLRWLCKQNETVFITRDRRASVSTQVGQVSGALGGRPLVMFPEGTTGDGTALLPFKSALLSAAEDARAGPDALGVQPVALAYADAPGMAWFGEEPGLRNVVRLLGRLAPLHLTIHFLDPLQGTRLADRKAMAAAAQAAIAHALRL